MSSVGKFITLEGIEGSGKTTHLKYLETLLSQKGISTVVTREPGGTPLAERIRQLLLEHHTEIISEETELLLMFAARAQHIANVIKPALTKGQWVLCSRFTDSTYAYQGGGRQISLQRIASLEKFVHPDLNPDKVFLFDLPAHIGLFRARQRNALDRIESEEIEFFERARQVYLDRASQNPLCHVIDATQSIPVIQSLLRGLLDT